VSPDQLREQIELVRELDSRMDGIRVLIGTETNILTGGTPDYDDDLLAELDWVVGSLHTSFRMTEREQTERMIAAMEHPLIDVIGHPTGRLIERRRPYALDVDAVIEAAVRTRTFLEINGNPDRRDLNEVNARQAVEAGVTLCIQSDAHGTETLRNIRYGVATARRAWIGPDSIANTRSWEELDGMRKTPRLAGAKRR
jgi:DNA polymerase (family 10)